MPLNDTGDPNKLSLNSMLLATPARTEDKPSLLPVLSSARKKDEGGKDGGMALIESLATAEVVSIKERQEKEERELISTTSGKRVCGVVVVGEGEGERIVPPSPITSHKTNLCV
jgi:hypothetical protein